MSYRNWIAVLNAYKAKLAQDCGVQVILEPSTLQPERFHVRLVPIPHPVVVGNGRTRLRLRASASGEIPPSDRGVSDALDVSLKLALWFDEEQGGIAVAPGAWAVAYHQAIREDDELFTDLADERSYSYDEHWLVEIEFDYEAAALAVTTDA